MGAVKSITSAVGRTVNTGVRAITGNPKTPPPPPIVRLAAAPAPAPAPVPAAVPTPAITPLPVPSINTSFGGGLVSGDNSMSSRRDSSGSFGLGNIPDTKIDLTEPESERDEDSSITVKSPGVQADDEEKRRDALDKAKDYKMTSDSY
tara:strand:- start:147 stop:590 length:444 start_codon:yes stop_codon:yes gene_type:complete